MMSGKTKVYVAGPYSHPDPVENMHKAIHLGDRLLGMGYAPFVPHLTGTWHMLCPHQYETWLAYDMEWLTVCDVLLRMSGKSEGADKEVIYALNHGIHVVWNLSQLIREIPIYQRQFQTKFPGPPSETEEPAPNSQKPPSRLPYPAPSEPPAAYQTR